MTRMASCDSMKHSGMTRRTDGTLAAGRGSCRGVYESHYLRAVDPARPRGAWIRHTCTSGPGEAATGALWCTVWDAEAGPPYAVKQSLPAPSPPEARSTRSAAGAEARGRSAAWDLEAAGERRRLCATSRARGCTARRCPRTKPESPLPDAVFTGLARGGRAADRGRRLARDGRAQLGLEHAERWVWLHAVGFAEAPGAWLDVALGRVQVGRRRRRGWPTAR